jgi:hypothetical protein
VIKRSARPSGRAASIFLSTAKRRLREPLHFLPGAAVRRTAGTAGARVGATSKRFSCRSTILFAGLAIPGAGGANRRRRNYPAIENVVNEVLIARLCNGAGYDDEIVKRRMAQKPSSCRGRGRAREPTTAELKSWFEKASRSPARPVELSLFYFHLTFAASAPATMRQRR